MNTTEIQPVGADPAIQADLEAVIRHALAGTPLEPDLALRINERSQRVQEELRRSLTEADLAVRLLREVRDEACGT